MATVANLAATRGARISDSRFVAGGPVATRQRQRVCELLLAEADVEAFSRQIELAVAIRVG
jgi:hypothetical protein